ncbi:hypothetical protein C8J57DRAFT_1222130 [Mycena rebaudengoi]|nr:hypothetical protein C8J57DRAFT_1235014 [Mycena rebaudengoi]KAJ7278275.1 hypothetical protein C8J57DRAFT_1222130 [Mycena rebaudengoi]
MHTSSLHPLASLCTIFLLLHLVGTIHGATARLKSDRSTTKRSQIGITRCTALEYILSYRIPTTDCPDSTKDELSYPIYSLFFRIGLSYQLKWSAKAVKIGLDSITDLGNVPGTLPWNPREVHESTFGIDTNVKRIETGGRSERVFFFRGGDIILPWCKCLNHEITEETGGNVRELGNSRIFDSTVTSTHNVGRDRGVATY